MDLAMIAVPVPGVASIVQSILLNLIYIDILQTDLWLIPAIKEANKLSAEDLSSDRSFNYYFESSGFSSTIMLINMGSTLVYVAFYASLVVIYLLLEAIGIFNKRYALRNTNFLESNHWHKGLEGICSGTHFCD